jgi:hypothetical protein
MDWAIKAATELADLYPSGSGRDGYITDEQRARIAARYVEILSRHIPRCESCRHWTKHVLPVIDGTCTSEETKRRVTQDEWGELTTAADFGCVQWEAK